MAEFAWEARTRNGEAKSGTMEADNEAAVQARLRSQQMTPTKIKKNLVFKNPFGGSGVGEKDLLIFIRQFATMIDAGLPLVQSLDILSARGDNPAFNKVLQGIKSEVEQGSTFSAALGKYPAVFDELFVNLVAAGEIGGILDSILARLGEYIEKRSKLKRQVRGAMAYPIGIFCIAIIVLIVLLVWVMPTFKMMFADFGAVDEMPKITQFVIGLSDGFIDNWYIFAGIAGGLFYSLKFSYSIPKGKELWHKFFLAAPVFGSLTRKIAVARFTRTMGTLLAAGVPILDAMEIVAKTAGNIMIERAIRHVAEQVSQGRTMAEPLMETGVFPPMVVQMIGVGEQTGALDAMLGKIADFYEEEVDVAVAALTSLMEPIMMVVIGGMVGTMLIAMYMPIFDIAGKIKAN